MGDVRIMNTKPNNDIDRKQILLSGIDFSSGKIENYSPIQGSDGVKVLYSKGISMEIWWWENNHHRINCNVKRQGEIVNPFGFNRLDEKSLNIIQHCVSEIENGKYNNKKRLSDRVQEEIIRRGLASYMNNTKWREFCEAMQNEMPFQPPYIYKTLFEDDNGDYFEFTGEQNGPDSYDRESFAYYDFKIIEWVKVWPRYYDYVGGRLAGKKIYHEADKEFVDILSKYDIPYEEKDGMYIIYGYK